MKSHSKKFVREGLLKEMQINEVQGHMDKTKFLQEKGKPRMVSETLPK